MTRESLHFFLLLFFFVLLCYYPIFGQANVVRWNERIPTDKDLRYGELKNGFKYYLKRDKNSKGQLLLYFLVKAGAENEREDQLECAHLLEHVALHGTKDFPDIRFFLQSHGVAWGSDFNGSTSAKSTLYRLSIPEGNRELLSSCLMIIRNWANGEVSFDSVRVQAEKGAVFQELSMNIGEFSRMHQEFVASVIGAGNHNGRVQIDTRSTLIKLKPAQLSQYFHDWYVPNREGLVVIGNVNVDSLESRIRVQFGKLAVKRQKKELEEPYLSSLTLDGHNDVNVLKKNEKQFIEGKIVLKSSYRPIVTYGDLKSDLLRTLLSYLLDFRFRQANRLASEQGYLVEFNRLLSDFGHAFSFIEIDFKCDSVQLRSTYTGLMEELFRIDRLGFSVEEVRVAKDRLRKELKHSFAEGRGLDLNDCIGNFMWGAAIPAPETRRRLVFEILNGMVNKDISQFLKEWPLTQNRDVVFFVPRAYEGGLFSLEKVNKWTREAEISPLKPFQYVEKEYHQTNTKSFPPLIAEEESKQLGNSLPPLIRSKIESVNAVSVRLANGIHVILKQFASDADSGIYIQGLKRLEAFVKDRSDSLLEKYSSNLVSASGLGNYSVDEWTQYKMHKKITISHNFKSGGAVVFGQGNLGNQEDILHAIRLSIINPKIDCVLFERWKLLQIQKIRSSKNELSSSSRKYTSLLASMFVPLVELEKEKEVSDITLNSILGKYKEMYGNDGSYTFVVCGNFSLESILFLLNKYIGTIPVDSRRRDEISSGIREIERKGMPEVQRNYPTQVFYDSSLTTSRVDILFPVTIPIRSCSNAAMEIIADEFMRLIVDRLRTKEGISYAPTVSVLSRWKASGQYLFSVHFDCANDRVDDGIRFAKEEFARLRDVNTQYLLFEASKALVESQIQEKSHKPSYWLDYFEESFLSGSDFSQLTDCNAILDELTVKDLFDLMRFFSDDGAIAFALCPKGSAAN